MNADDELTYIQQLESRIDAFEEMNGKQWQELGDQDKVIDKLTAEVAASRAMTLALLGMYLDVTKS